MRAAARAAWRARSALGTRSLASSARMPRLNASLPGAQALMRSLEKAPCLECGLTVPVAERVECRLSGLPLACSQTCDDELYHSRRELLERFCSLAEDVEFASSTDARRLFTEVLAPARRRATPSSATVSNWQDYVGLYTTDACWLKDPRALRLASSAFSFVLTLGAFLPAVVPATTDAVTLHVVGARAEATMPDALWDEVALLHPTRSFDIKLVGDHVPIARSTASARGLPLVVEAVRGLYHDTAVSTGPAPDAFVLFNPGVGHPQLRARWRPTLAALLATGRPLLLTAFSNTDQARDIDALHEVATEINSTLDFVVSPRENPFGSRKWQINDDGGAFTLIQTNARVLVVRLAR